MPITDRQTAEQIAEWLEDTARAHVDEGLQRAMEASSATVDWMARPSQRRERLMRQLALLSEESQLKAEAVRDTAEALRRSIAEGTDLEPPDLTDPSPEEAEPPPSTDTATTVGDSDASGDPTR